MIINHISGATRVLGKSQGYLGLPVRDETITDSTTGGEVNCMSTSWEPTPAELALLNQGRPVTVRLFGKAHPPIIVEVTDAQRD